MADPYAGIGADPYAGIGAPRSSPPAAKRSGFDAVRDFMTTVNENVPGFDELQAGVDALRVMGRSHVGFPEAWKAVRDDQSAREQAFAANSPTASNLARGTGWAAQAVPAILSGGATATPQAAAVAPTLGARAAGIAATGARNATVGGMYAAVNGVAGRGTIPQRLEAGAKAVPGGMVAGAVLPPILAAGGKATGAALGVGAKTAVRVANKATGGALRDPQQEALTRLGEAFRKDKLTPDQVTQAMNEWQRVGGPSPSFLDLVGENTKALVRAAAMTGDGRAAAVNYGNRIAADAQDLAMNRTRRLTPDQRPAVAVAQDLADTQGNLASQQYAQPYAEPVTMTPEALSALRGPDGRTAISRAMKAAQARQDYQQMGELQSLLNADLDHPPVISAGALDRVRIAMGERGAQMRNAGSRDIGAGLFGRASGIDTALDATPGLGPARATYRNMQAQRDALDLGLGARQMDPADYAAQLADLAQNGPRGAQLPGGGQIGVGGAQDAAGIGLRSDMVRAIGEPADNATGVLNRFGSSPNMGDRLATTFGDQAASDYQQSLRNIVSQVNNARFINVNKGSQSAPLLADTALVDGLASPKGAAIKYLLDKLKAGATLTDAEREAIVNLATGSPDAVPLGDFTRPSITRRGPPLLPQFAGTASGNNRQ